MKIDKRKMVKAYIEMGKINLTISKEFFNLEHEVFKKGI